MPTIEELLKEFGDEPSTYTRERYEADHKRLLAILAKKHCIAESEVPALIHEHRYTHTAEDPEQDYIEIMAIASLMGWTTL